MTENGWPPDTDAHPFVSIPLDRCVQVTIPGTSETLWFQKGAPAVLLPAFAAAMNEYIEPLLNSQGYNDEGTWTNGNSVGSSNHLGATAMDYNWSDHPMGPDAEDPDAGWQGSTLIDGDEVPAIRELLNFCEGTIFWGADWSTPKDSMHFQVGYNTYDPATGDAQQWVKDFIARKIGPDGKLTWRPSWLPADDGDTAAPTPAAPAPAPPPGTADDTAPAVDTLFADVSEYQVPVDDTYPYPVLSIRVSDGTYQDHNFAENYAWMRAALDDGRLVMGIIYTFVRPLSWQDNADTVRSMIDAAGGLHPRVALMLDVERGGNPAGDQSGPINALYDNLADYAGNRARVIGYANSGDEASMWQTRPPGLRFIGAGYPTDPQLPGQLAHQYTDGSGYGAPFPQGAAPFGNCDMNSADGLSADDLAALCGIGTTPPAQPTPGGPLMALTDAEQQELLAKTRDIWDQLRGPDGAGWPQLGQNDQGQNLTPIDAIAAIKTQTTPKPTKAAAAKAGS